MICQLKLSISTLLLIVIWILHLVQYLRGLALLKELIISY